MFNTSYQYVWNKSKIKSRPNTLEFCFMLPSNKPHPLYWVNDEISKKQLFYFDDNRILKQTIAECSLIKQTQLNVLDTYQPKGISIYSASACSG